MRFAYADPPYPGLSAKYYRDEPSFAGEVDHRLLVTALESAALDGWALSTSPRSLRDVLPLCPSHARVCAWVKPGGAPPSTRGLHNVWEALIVVDGRRATAARDALYAHAARGGGELMGRKPISFSAWLCDALGVQACDVFFDLFPGSRAVGNAVTSLGAHAFDGALRDRAERAVRFLEPHELGELGGGRRRPYVAPTLTELGRERPC